MGVISVMNPHLSNLIAAGEVVDRPVNIVKESVENALDAGASSIEIEVFQGGIEGVIVSDDGCGMDQEDACLAFSRHASSKLKDEEDLFNIQTMGFRGEALASIASVADVDLQTNNGKDQTHVRVEYGKITVCEEYPCPRGTRLEVRGLFVNTPARFKYLKKAGYEFSIISETVNKLAITHPDVRFVLKHDGRLVFQTSGKGKQSEILYQMYGREVAANAKEFYNFSDDFVISGLAVQPKISRANKHFIYVSVNNRIVRSYPVLKAVLEGYGEFLPKDRYPIVFINIEVDPQLVDVNVHPNKLEVRISKEEYLCQLIITTLESLFSKELETVAVDRTLQESVRQDSLLLSYPVKRNTQEIKTDIKKPDPLFLQEETNFKSVSKPAFTENGQANPVGYPVPVKEEELSVKGHPLFQNYGKDNGALSASFIDKHQISPSLIQKEIRREFGGMVPGSLSSSGSKQSEPRPDMFKEESPEKGMEFFDHLRVIGQLRESYILCENPQGLVIIDQHAAQERYNFERLEKEFEKPVTVLQPLMVPMRLSVSADVFCMLDEINAHTEYYGLKFEAFGDNQFLLRQEPAWLQQVDRETFLQDLLDWFKVQKTLDVKKLNRHMIATKACHSSIRFNRLLNKSEMEQVVEDLKKCRQPYHCPHGRPTVITLSDALLKKEFERG